MFHSLTGLSASWFLDDVGVSVRVYGLSNPPHFSLAYFNFHPIKTVIVIYVQPELARWLLTDCAHTALFDEQRIEFYESEPAVDPLETFIGSNFFLC